MFNRLWMISWAPVASDSELFPLCCVVGVVLCARKWIETSWESRARNNCIYWKVMCSFKFICHKKDGRTEADITWYYWQRTLRVIKICQGYVLFLLKKKHSIIHPTIGFIPAPLAALRKSNTPNILPWSVMATELIPSSLTRFINFLMSEAPSRIEYWVCTCRCVKSGILVVVRRYKKAM